MPDAALSTLQTLSYLIFATAPRGMTFLQVRKLRCRKAKKLAADHGRDTARTPALPPAHLSKHWLVLVSEDQGQEVARGQPQCPVPLY